MSNERVNFSIPSVDLNYHWIANIVARFKDMKDAHYTIYLFRYDCFPLTEMMHLKAYEYGGVQPADVKRTKPDSPLNKIAFLADSGGLTFEVSWNSMIERI